MRCTQRRAAVQQRGYRFPVGALVGEAVGILGHAETIAGLQGDAGELAGERIVRLAFVRIHVDAGECLTAKFIGDDLARWIDSGAGVVDRSWTLGIPSGSLIARILQADRAPYRFGQQRGVHRRVAGIVAAV